MARGGVEGMASSRAAEGLDDGVGVGSAGSEVATFRHGGQEETW
jgi:hypothetical protein